jgi:hypothetical protein
MWENQVYESCDVCIVDTIERGDRGWKEAQRQGEDRVTLLTITLLSRLDVLLNSLVMSGPFPGPKYQA